jgi:hypothetical protein
LNREPRILLALQSKFYFSRVSGIADNSTNHDFKVGAKSMRRVVSASTMLGQPACQIFG